VIVKAHSSHPGTAELVAMAVQKAVAACGAPPGIFSLLHGPGATVGKRLVTHPLIKAVGFTGSRKAGRALFDAAVSRPDPIPVYAEMGSINPVFVLPGALRARKEEIAKGLTASATLGVGQFCTNPGLVIGLRSGELQDLVAQTGRLFEQVPAETMLNSRIAEAYQRGLDRLQNAPGVTIGGRSSAVPDAERNQAQPTLFSAEGKAFLSDSGLSEEVFGPSTLVIQASDREELLTVAAALEGHLTAAIHGTEEDLHEYAELMAVLQRKVGRLIVNGFPTGVEVCRSMNHGGPWPATTDVHFTSVGTAAIYRFARPVCYQDVPQSLLKKELQDANPLGILRQVDGDYTREAVSR
jgi:NADP-dependent aldehyde dehydrogenase